LRSAELKQQQEIQHFRRLHEGSNDSVRVLTQENVSLKSQYLELQARLAESAAMLQHQASNKGAAFEKMQTDLANSNRMIRTLEQVCFGFFFKKNLNISFRTSNHCRCNFLLSALSEWPLRIGSLCWSELQREWCV
jgi:hypothetical protein